MKEQKTSVGNVVDQDQDMAPLQKWVEIFKENSYWLTMSAVVVTALASGILVWNIRKESRLDDAWTEMAKIRQDPLGTAFMSPPLMQPIWKTLGVAIPPSSSEDVENRKKREADNDQRRALAQSGWHRLLAEQGKEDPILVKALLEQRARGTDAEPWVLYHLGSVYYARAEYDLAVGVFEELARGFQTHICGEWAKLDLERSRSEMNWKQEHVDQPIGVTVDVEIETTVGTLTITLYRDRSPELVKSFLQLVQSRKLEGMMFYNPTEGVGDVTMFCGDPNANGTGSLAPDLPENILPMSHVDGTVAMDIGGPGLSSGSRFYIIHNEEVTKASLLETLGQFARQLPPQYINQLVSDRRGKIEEYREWIRDNLDGKRSIVGKVTEGLDVLNGLRGHWILRARIVPSE
jgi:cyclophilin family peptidyl-prolyl cis-trans isomerase